MPSGENDPTDFPSIAGREHFTDREEAIEAFRRYINADAGHSLRVLAIHGVGGAGKTALVNRLADELDELDKAGDRIPYAKFALNNVKSPMNAYLEVLTFLRVTLGSNFGIEFPRFDLCLSVINQTEGEQPTQLVNPGPFYKLLYDMLKGAISGMAPNPAAGAVIGSALALESHIGDWIRNEAPKHRGLVEWIAKAGGAEEILRLRKRVQRQDETLPEFIVRRFAEDLRNAPARSGKSCRCVFFLDAYETLWRGDQAGSRSANARQLEWWAPLLAEQCQKAGVLLVVSGRDGLDWGNRTVDESWSPFIDSHLMGGFSAKDAQTFLSRCGIGYPPASDEPTPLQKAIIDLCNETISGDSYEIACHPFYLALCAETVLNLREKNGLDPPTSTFEGIPSEQIARRLADRFLKSLSDDRMERWLIDLSLTPVFDKSAALEMGRDRYHTVGIVDWERLIRFSFANRQPDGSFRLHDIMRDVLMELVPKEDIESLHNWYVDYWLKCKRRELTFYHRWSLDPESTLDKWVKSHERAIKDRMINEARDMFRDWSEIRHDNTDRRRIGDELWARTHTQIAITLLDTPFAPRQTTILEAIDHFNKALLVFNLNDFPIYWAMTLNNLGEAYRNLPEGDRKKNLSSAITYYKIALSVYDETRFSIEWATIQNNIGIVYIDLPGGDREENLIKAINYFESALSVRTKARFPLDWAATKNNLGIAYCYLQRGDRVKNLSFAIDLFEAVLHIRTEARTPIDWAATQNNLGNVYMNLPIGNREENLTKAILCYKKALQVRTELDFPVDWAITINNLANAFCDLPGKNRIENLNNAIIFYKASLRVFTEFDFPIDWAMTQNNLGTAYCDHLGENREENLRQAISCYEAALRVRTENAFPYQWALTQNNLGNVYWNLQEGNKEDNIKKAISYFNSALRVLTKDNFPIDWANTQNNLGNAYCNLHDENRTENLKYSIKCYKNAFKVYTQDKYPANWAMTMYNEAIAWYEIFSVFADSESFENTRNCVYNSLNGLKSVGLETDKAENLIRILDYISKNRS